MPTLHEIDINLWGYRPSVYFNFVSNTRSHEKMILTLLALQAGTQKEAKAFVGMGVQGHAESPDMILFFCVLYKAPHPEKVTYAIFVGQTCSKIIVTSLVRTTQKKLYTMAMLYSLHFLVILRLQISRHQQYQ